MKKRLFIGIPIESGKAILLTEPWRNNKSLNRNLLKWTGPENWHITLFFLGNTPESAISLLQQLIEESFTGIQSFSAKLSGVGVFPNTHSPKVLWIGLENLQRLMRAYTQLSDLLLQNGFSFDNKPLKPHLTLARIKSLENRVSFDSLLYQYRQFSFGSIAINCVVLYESIISPDGPIYKQLFVRELDRR